MSTNPFQNDVENNRNKDFNIDDESTLQPPPSSDPDDSDDVNDLHSVNVDDEEAPVHDQLPSPEEYKAKLSGNTNRSYSKSFAQFSPSKVAAEASEAGSVYGDDQSVVHDQLPNVDEYKSSGGYHDRKRESRPGLYTFLILFVLTAIITGVTVPLVLQSEEQQAAESNQVSGNGGGSSSDSGGSGGGSSSTRPPTNPQPPSNEAQKNRYEQVIDYLVGVGIANRATLVDDRTSPQYKAANWISNVDTLQFELPQGAGTDRVDNLPLHTRFTERYALAVFYYATGGDRWKYGMRFMEPIDHCEWYQDFITNTGNVLRLGVSECKTLGSGFVGEFVHGLQLPNNGLAGELPIEIQLFHRLTKLALPFNANLTSTNSLDGVHLLQYLTDLELQYCSFSGQIPNWFGNLRSLTNLLFGNNLLSGALPGTFFNLTNLVVLGLDDNTLSGPIAPFAALSNLESLYLEDNGFTGELSDSLFSAWNKLIELDLSVNNLDGPLPSNMWSTSTLEVVDIHRNEFVGIIPEITTSHDRLFFLALHDNKLDWRIPETISNLVNLAHLDVSKNNLVLPFPSTMTELTSLRYLFTGQNSFDDHRIPTFLNQMSNLRELSMKDNSLTGQIPSFLGNLTRLQVLDMDMNKLTGPIPEELGQLTGISTLLLNRNNLNGTLPTSFSKMKSLNVLLVDGNDIGDTASIICDDPKLNLTRFVADCAEPNPEIVCTCCSLCCDDSNTTCNNFDWHLNLDPIWEYGFRRVVYSFSQNLLPPEDET